MEKVTFIHHLVREGLRINTSFPLPYLLFNYKEITEKVHGIDDRREKR